MRELDGLCRSIAGAYFVPDGDHDDLCQEARWGLAKAVRDFRGEGTAHFIAFARMCIRRQVITAVKQATLVRNRSMNERVSMEQEVKTPWSRTRVPLGDLLFSYASDPVRVVIAREAAHELAQRMEALSPWERECVDRVLIAGERYEAVGEEKRVDNALQRARRKLAPVVELEPAGESHGFTSRAGSRLAA